MDRTFVARAPIGRLSRPFAFKFALPRPTTSRLCVALAVLALLGGGWLWLRNSPLVAVERVQISGVQGVEAGSIDTALRSAARQMSTLNVSVGSLRAAVARFRVVRDLSVSTSFPHGLRIRVVEQLPVASLSVGGAHTAVAADGVVLGSELLARLHAQLPTIVLAGSPAFADLRSLGGRVENATVRAQLSLLGAAPRVLLGWVSKVSMGHEGLTVAMRGGVLIYFGDATRPHAKWLAAARVLADPSSAGATYVDVRAPERPAAGTNAAGGLEGGATPAQVGASDPTSAALANVLAEAVNGSSGVITSTAPTSTAASATPAAPSSSSGSSASESSASESSASGSSASGSSASESSASESSASESSATAPTAAESSTVAPAGSTAEDSPSTSG